MPLFEASNYTISTFQAWYFKADMIGYLMFIGTKAEWLLPQFYVLFKFKSFSFSLLNEIKNTSNLNR